MLIFDAYAKTWTMCLFSFGFFVVAAALATFVKIPRLERTLSPRAVFRLNVIAWVLFMGLLLTLIDKPHFDMSKENLDWLFMFSAFLGIPVATPLLAWAIWAFACGQTGQPVKLSTLALLGLGAFALGCAASNIHDIVWCGVITSGYTEHFKAGYDLDLFVAFGKLFGIPEKVTQDYATLGPYTMVLVLGELLTAAAAFRRLKRPAGPPM